MDAPQNQNGNDNESLDMLTAAVDQPTAPGQAPFAGPGQAANPYGASYVAPAGPESLLPSVAGAVLGAALGMGAWIGVGVAFNREIGIVAIMVGVLAGWGAVVVGKRKSAAIGMIAATAGLLGILAGSYLNFRISLYSDEAKAAVHRIVDKAAAGTPDMTAEKKQALYDAVYKDAIANIGYFDSIGKDGKSLGFLALFGFLGLYYGYRVGSGAGRR